MRSSSFFISVSRSTICRLRFANSTDLVSTRVSFFVLLKGSFLTLGTYAGAMPRWKYGIRLYHSKLVFDFARECVKIAPVRNDLEPNSFRRMPMLCFVNAKD